MRKRVLPHRQVWFCLLMLLLPVCKDAVGPGQGTTEDFYPLGYGYLRVYNHYDAQGNITGYDSIRTVDTCTIRGYPGYVEVEKIQTTTYSWQDTTYLMAYPNRIEFIADTGAGYNYDTLTNTHALYFRHSYVGQTFSVYAGGGARKDLTLIRKPTCSCAVGTLSNCLRMVLIEGMDTLNVWEFANGVGMVNTWEDNKLEMSLAYKNFKVGP